MAQALRTLRSWRTIAINSRWSFSVFSLRTFRELPCHRERRKHTWKIQLLRGRKAKELISLSDSASPRQNALSFGYIDGVSAENTLTKVAFGPRPSNVDGGIVRFKGCLTICTATNGPSTLQSDRQPVFPRPSGLTQTPVLPSSSLPHPYGDIDRSC